METTVTEQNTLLVLPILSAEDGVVDIDSLVKEMGEGMEEKVRKSRQDHADIYPLRREILNAECSMADFDPGEGNDVNMVRNEFFVVLEELIESIRSHQLYEPTSDELVRQTCKALLAWQKAKSSVKPMVSESGRRSSGRGYMEFGLRPPTPSKASRIVGERWPLVQSGPSRKARREAAERRTYEIALAEARVRGLEEVILEYSNGMISQEDFDGAVEDFGRPPRQIDKRYLWNGGSGFCEASRTRAVQSQPKDKKKKKGNKSTQQGGNRGGRK